MSKRNSCSTLEFEDNSSSEISSNEYTSDDLCLSVKSNSTNGKQNKQKIQRLPTRVPDPKVKNRNALLARENRKRKKEIMDTMMQNINDLRNENKKLKKLMKLKDLKTASLKNEINYFKNVLANKTEIMTILRSLPKSLPTNSSAYNWIKSDIKEEPYQIGYSPVLSSSATDDYENNDYQMPKEWDLMDKPILESETVIKQEVINEHNYFEIDDEVDTSTKPGICVHVNGGRISLEFCASCHTNATNAWDEEES